VFSRQHSVGDSGPGVLAHDLLFSLGDVEIALTMLDAASALSFSGALRRFIPAYAQGNFCLVLRLNRAVVGGPGSVQAALDDTGHDELKRGQ